MYSPTRRAHVTRCAWLTMVAGLSGCVSTHVVDYYDEECQIVARKMALDVDGEFGMSPCADTQSCTRQLVANGLIPAASVVVSGSIVMVGNVVYWFEKQGQCAKAKAKRKQPETVGNTAGA